MNKASRHFDDLTCSRRAPGIAALLSLFVRVRAIANAFAAAPRLEGQAAEVGALAGAVRTELERRSCSLPPAGRTRRRPAWAARGARADEQPQPDKPSTDDVGQIRSEGTVIHQMTFRAPACLATRVHARLPSLGS
jgi:hypothetical protein